MMKRLIVLVAAIAAMATVASGAVVAVQFHNLGTGSIDGSISSDGMRVAGSVLDTTVYVARFPAYWTANANGSAPVKTNGNGGWGAGYYGGIDQKAGGTLWTSANAGTSTYTAANFTGRYGTPLIAGGLRDHNGTASNATVGGNNSISATADGTDAWIAGSWTAGVSNKGNDGQIWLMSSGATAIFHPTNTGKVDLRSIARNGNAVGQDRGGVGYSGAGSAARAVYWTVANTTTVLPIPSFAGNGTTTQSQGFGVSDDGTKFTGLMHKAGDANTKAFVWTMGDANSIMLDRPTGWTGTPTVIYGYDVANDGTVVGSSFMDDSLMPGGFAGNHDVGTIWFAGETVGKRVLDVLMAAGLDVSNVRFLGRTYGIAGLDNGRYAISGEGSFWLDKDAGTYEARAWYAVIPEPATLGFMVLGGLALIRRRR